MICVAAYLQCWFRVMLLHCELHVWAYYYAWYCRVCMCCGYVRCVYVWLCMPIQLLFMCLHIMCVHVMLCYAVNVVVCLMCVYSRTCQLVCHVLVVVCYMCSLPCVVMHVHVLCCGGA